MAIPSFIDFRVVNVCKDSSLLVLSGSQNLTKLFHSWHGNTEFVPQFWKFGILTSTWSKFNLIFTFKNLPDKNLSWHSIRPSCSICLCCTAQIHPHCMVTAPNCDTYPKASLLDSGQIQPWVEHASLGSVLDTYNQRVKNLQFNHMMSKNYIFICWNAFSITNMTQQKVIQCWYRCSTAWKGNYRCSWHKLHIFMYFNPHVWAKQTNQDPSWGRRG